MASGDSGYATSVRILNENVDKLTRLPDMVKAFEELTNEEVILLSVLCCYVVTKCLSDALLRHHCHHRLASLSAFLMLLPAYWISFLVVSRYFCFGSAL